MSKKRDLPAQQWYWGDWFKATDIMALPRDTRDVWHMMLGRMWESTERGYLSIAGRPPTDDELCSLLGFGCVSSLPDGVKGGVRGRVVEEMQKHLKYLGERKIYSVDDRGIIYCRRIVEEESKRLRAIEFGKMGGNPKLTGVKGGVRETVKGMVNSSGYPFPEDEDEDENISDSDTRKKSSPRKYSAKHEDVCKVYDSYPTTCPIRGVSTGKSRKAHEPKIKALLKQYTVDDLCTIQTRYIDDCKRTNTYIKGYGTFLNNLPDSLLDDPQDKPKPIEAPRDPKDRSDDRNWC